MSKSGNNLTSLGKSLSRRKNVVSGGLALPTGSGSPSPEARSASQKLSATTNGGLRSQSLNAKAATGVHFGKSSSSRSSTSATSDLSNLLKSAESTGLNSLLGGGLLGGLSIFGSLGSVVGGLFGAETGSKSLPPLTTFSLPQAQTENYSINTGAAHIGSSQTSGMYKSSSNQSTTTPTSSHIAQAVKTALLQSSSLNDVINEL